MKAWIDKQTYESMEPEGTYAMDLKYAPGTGLMGVHFFTDDQLKEVIKIIIQVSDVLSPDEIFSVLMEEE